MTSGRLPGHDDRPLTIPQCCACHRLAGLDAVETLVLNDTLSRYDDMVAAGWPAPDALDALRHSYRAWILGRFGDAIDRGCDLLELEAVA